MFALIDCNNFFVSCERVFRPDLENKPVIVLSNNDGCAIARSNEAKLLGIPMGAPLFEIRHLVKAYDIQVLSCNFELYGDMSRRVMNILQQECEKVEVYSVDEAFLEFNDSINWAEEGDRLRKHILQCTGIPTSIGFGPTKTLAKLANLESKVRGISCYIDHTKAYHDNLKAIPVAKIWGIGTRLNKSLKEHGVYTAYDLMTTDPAWARRKYNVIVERTVRELGGISCLSLSLIQESKKSIQITRSLSEPVQDLETLKQIIARYGFRLAHKLRASSQKTMTIWVYARNSRYRSEKPVFHQQTIVLAAPTNDTTSIITLAQQAVESFFDPTVAYHKLGIMAIDLRDANAPSAKELFVSVNQSRKPDIDKVMDSINQRFGLGTVRPLSCGQSVGWMNKRDHKTPAYTTNWKTLVEVKAK